MLELIVIPPVRDPWSTPKKRSRLRALALRKCPTPADIRWYPQLPPADASVWAIFRKGHCGEVVFLGGWTYKSGSEFLYDMPIAWTLLRHNAKVQARPCRQKGGKDVALEPVVGRQRTEEGA
jgi:hypothetical protein